MKASVKKLALDPIFILRLGLAGVFIYAGVGMLVSPELWIGFVPAWFGDVINPDIFLVIHGIFEVILGMIILSGFFLSVVSFVAFLDLLSIILFYGIDAITFRDFGLTMAALALFLMIYTSGRY